jgi:hypothetical protein
MSSLIFYTDPQQALVVTDTLAVDGTTPALFVTKAHYLPHLRLIVAGTGIGRFSDDWFVRINSRMLVSGIEQLDQFTPEHLRELWENFNSEHSSLQGKTTTVYHFGVSEATQEITTFAYRSYRDFESERLPHGTGAKPDCAIPEGEVNIYEHIRSMMEEQRALQAKLRLPEQIHIGGEAMAIHLTANGCNHHRMFQFPDYDEQVAQALGNLPKVI